LTVVLFLIKGGYPFKLKTWKKKSFVAMIKFILGFLSLMFFNLVMGQSAPRMNIPGKIANDSAACMLACVNVWT